MELDLIKKVVSSAIKRVPRDKDRCHEVARFFAKELIKNSITSKVYDGVAIYPSRYLITQAFGQSGWSEELPSSIYQKVAVLHSWVETPETVVDYHPMLHLGSDLILEGLLMVEDTATIKSYVDYDPCGRFIQMFGVVAIPWPKEDRVIPRLPIYYLKKIKKI